MGLSRWLAWTIPLCWLLAACTLDRTPQESGRNRTYGARLGTGAVAAGNDDDVLLGTDMENRGPSDFDNSNVNTQGGLSCGGLSCPFTAPPVEPCCTTADDVTAGSARAVDRCGIDLGNTSSPTGGDHCWQRDQGGVLDESCPSVSSIAGQSEVGCCTEQGRCGTWNASLGVGCHYNVGVAEACGEDEIIEDVTCEPTGVYAARVDVDVAWGGRSGGLAALTDDGRGPITIHLKATIEALDGGNEMIGRMETCGVSLPAFYSSTLCESYVPVFPASIWQSDRLPEIPLSGRFQCLSPGCILTFDAQTVLLGISLENPEAPWPTPAMTGELECPAGKGERCFPDHDDDGYPGLTVELLTSGMAPPGIGCNGVYTQEGAPLSASPASIFDGVRRTDRIFLGTRTKLGGSGRIGENCGGGEGAGIAEFVQSRAWGCFAQEGTANFPGPAAGPDDPCLAPEAQFMDENLPIYHILAQGEEPADNLNVVDESPSRGPTTRVARLGGLELDASCADVRAALP